MPSKLEEAIQKRDEAAMEFNKVAREFIEAEIRESVSVAGRATGLNRKRGKRNRLGRQMKEEEHREIAQLPPRR